MLQKIKEGIGFPPPAERHHRLQPEPHLRPPACRPHAAPGPARPGCPRGSPDRSGHPLTGSWGSVAVPLSGCPLPAGRAAACRQWRQPQMLRTRPPPPTCPPLLCTLADFPRKICDREDQCFGKRRQAHPSGNPSFGHRREQVPWRASRSRPCQFSL